MSCSAMKTPVTTSPSSSLLDGYRYFEWTVVYYPRVPHYFWSAWMKQGFRHCELWRRYSYGDSVSEVGWLRVTPTFEILEAEIDTNPAPPETRFLGCTVQPVTILSRAHLVRQWFHIGPVSCVDFCKAALGINSFWVRTPWQLYKYVKRRGGVLRHG